MTISLLQKKARQVGTYELLEKLGDGATGTVYRARHQATNDVVAVKLLVPDHAGNPVHVKRFEQEARAAARLDHPHVVRVLDSGCESGMQYLVMELVEGRSLGQRIAREGRLGEEEAVEVILQVASGVQHVHEAGLIHRDIKPDNILLERGGRAKLADLGLVKIVDDEVELTRPNSGLGTPNYMAPEQFCNAKHADFRCDLYSLGATLYSAVTGVVPFASSNVMAVLKKKYTCELAPARHLVPGLSEQLERTIIRAMNLDPRHRHSGCAEFMAELTRQRPGRAEGAEQNPTPRASPAQPSGKDRRAFVRYASDKEGHCQTLGGFKDDRWAVRIVDVSRNGIGLVANRRFEVGSTLAVAVQPREPDTLPLFVRVVRLEARPAGKWLLGCTFANLLGEEEVRGLV